MQAREIQRLQGTPRSQQHSSPMAASQPVLASLLHAFFTLMRTCLVWRNSATVSTLIPHKHFHHNRIFLGFPILRRYISLLWLFHAIVHHFTPCFRIKISCLVAGTTAHYRNWAAQLQARYQMFAPDAARPAKRVYIGNLPPEITEAELRQGVNDIMVKCGGICMAGFPITSCKLYPVSNKIYVFF
jgi:hypothetical protein